MQSLPQGKCTLLRHFFSEKLAYQAPTKSLRFCPYRQVFSLYNQKKASNDFVGSTIII